MKSKNSCLNTLIRSNSKRLVYAVTGLSLFASLGCNSTEIQESSSNYNVLMICIDDLRPELGCYGNSTIKTPNIDKLASSAYLFNNHYVQSAICGPSRSSMLTGKVCQEWDPWREIREMKSESNSKLDGEPDSPVSLPHLFKKGGYETIGIGKITHEPGGVMDSAQQIAQIPFSWDTTYTSVGKWDTPWRSFFAYSNGDAHNTAMRIGLDTPRTPYEAGDVADEGYPDGLNALDAIKQLQRLKEGSTPFFLALGFCKPHLPFNAPKRYWDMYERSEIPMAENNFKPENLDNIYSINKSPEITTHYPWPDGPGNVSPESARLLKHGYYACVSYIDALVGEVLDELDRLDLSKNTVVVLWSDHGWHLGEHTMFGKMSNFEIATRSPLIVRVPEVTNGGKKLTQLVESIDIYPTLAELCGLNSPKDLDGESFVDLLKNPELEGPEFARSFYYRNRALGKTIRTKRYRVIRWATENDSTVAVELYDHKLDPNENVNIANEQIEITNSLLKRLEEVEFIDKEMPFQNGWE